MKTFYQKVDHRNRKSMIDFLTGHFRYDTMNSWNRSTSYANDLKITHLGLTHDQTMKLFDIMECEDAYEDIKIMMSRFGKDHDWRWQVGFNGRSGGYLVLYIGGWKNSEYKSYCTVCRQRNFTSVKETGCKCGRCGKNTRRDFDSPLKEIFTQPGRSVDMDEDFEDWSIEELRDRVRLVEEFDKLCDKIVAQAVWMADNLKTEIQTVMVPETRKVIKTCQA